MLISDAMIAALPEGERELLLTLLQQHEKARTREDATQKFMPFVKLMWPGFVEGRHHRIMADAFERIASGKLKRVIINMAPRHTKSEFASYLFPAWYLGRYPDKKVIQASHTAELSVGFGRKVRNLVNSETYTGVFSSTKLQADSKAAGRWQTDVGGEYFAVGVGGALAGKGADLLVIDDPHTEQDAVMGMFSPETYNKAYEWYTTGPRQRLQPGAAICIVMTRWSKADLTGRLLEKGLKGMGASEWEVIELPALMPSGEPMWPEFWTKGELEAVKADIPVGRWNAQYLQTPTSEEGALIKRDWWKVWKQEKPPKCDSIIVSWDTAFETKARSDYSACTTWGVFSVEGKDGRKHQNLILLDAFRDKMEFPELKRVAKKHYDFWNPDAFVVEASAAGLPLIHEMRAYGIPVEDNRVNRHNDKKARVNAISDMFRSGFVWYPDQRWAEEVIEECAEFPNGSHDDYVDSVSQALLRARRGGLLLETDFEFGRKLDDLSVPDNPY